MTRISILIAALVSGMAFMGCPSPSNETGADDTNVNPETVTVTFNVTLPNVPDPPNGESPTIDIDGCYAQGICPADTSYAYNGALVTVTIKAPLGLEWNHTVEVTGGGIGCTKQTFPATGTEGESFDVAWAIDECMFDGVPGTYGDGNGHEAEVDFGFRDLDRDSVEEAAISFMGDWSILELNSSNVAFGGTVTIENSLRDLTWLLDGTSYPLSLVY